MTLTEFLLARISDREMLARDMQHQAAMGRPLLLLRGGGTLIRELVDPARVLSECEAQRAIIEDCASYEDENYASTDGLGLRTLRRFALPHADHPDYRQEWKP